MPEAIKMGLKLADALDKAHRSGVIHRDLKAANIMLTDEGTKLVDFGLAKTAPSGNGGVDWPADSPTAGAGGITGAGTILGTLHYMAPEQLEGRDGDAPSDIFAFGAVLYEMLTGRAERLARFRHEARVLALSITRYAHIYGEQMKLTVTHIDPLCRS